MPQPGLLGESSSTSAFEYGKPLLMTSPIASRSGPHASHKRRKLAGLLISGGTLLVCFICVFLIEFFTRSTQKRLTPLDVFITTPQQQQQVAGENTTGMFEGDPLLGWRLRPNLRRFIWDFTVVTTNEQGLRMEPALLPKASGDLRVACFGDSVTFGYRVPVVWPERPSSFDWRDRAYPQILDEKLRAIRPTRRIEVLPIAVPGYTSHQGLAWMKRDLRKLQPDVVTICYGWNDISESALPDRESMSTTPVKVLTRKLITKSQFLMHFSRWRSTQATNRRYDGSYNQARTAKSEYVRNILAMANYAKSPEMGGARVLIIGPVYRDSETNPDEAKRMTAYRDALREAARAAQVPYCEIPELLESAHPNNKELFGELIHPNARGHEIMAEAISTEVERMLP